MGNDEALKQKMMDYIERMIKDAYSAGFTDGWENSGKAFNGEIGPYTDSDEYKNMLSEFLSKYDENYELPE